MPNTARTHTDGGAVMRRTWITEERHYWCPSRSFKKCWSITPSQFTFPIYSNGSSSPQWTCSQRFNSIASAWVSHATGILVYRLTMQGSCLDDPFIVSLYTSRVCLCPCVITPRGFTSLTEQEAEYRFGPTNKKTNKGHGNFEIMTSTSHYTG